MLYLGATNIKMHSTIQIEKCITHTATKGWKNVKVGHVLKLTMMIASNFGRSGTSQSYIEIENLTNGEKFESSIAIVAKMLKNNFLATEI